LDLKKKEGCQSQIYREKVTAERISTFARAVGSGQIGFSIAPPTFMTCFRKGEFEIIAMLELKLENVLHAEQVYEYFSDIQAGDEIDFRSTLTHVLEKKNATGRLCFLTVETDVSASDKRLGTSSTTIVVREKSSA
jgi:hypothetical protein